MKRLRSRKPATHALPRWVVKSLAPWSVGACLLLSFTASAGPRTDAFEGLPRLSTVLSLRSISLEPPVQLALPKPHRQAGQQERHKDSHVFAGWIVQPRIDSSLALQEIHVPQALMFIDLPKLLPATRMHQSIRSDLAASSGGGVYSLQAFEGTTLDGSYGEIPPNTSTAGSSPTSLALLTAAVPDGATPAIPRAVSLASATPAPAEPQIVTLQPRLNNAPVAGVAAKAPALPAPKANPPRASYADLIDPEDMNKEQRCLAEAVYFEARSETPEGQAAVAQVVLNRVKSGLYPDSVCGVVYQNRHRYMACQFSFACEGKSLRITEPGPWKQAVKVARNVTFGETYLSKVGNALNYHASYVKPSWRHMFRKADTIGTHIFYRPKDRPT